MTIANGSYTFGSGGDYATLGAALNDVANALAANLTLTQVGDTANEPAVNRSGGTQIDIGSFNFYIQTDNAHDGVIGGGHVMDHSAGGGIILSVAGTGLLRVQDLEFVNAVTAKSYEFYADDTTTVELHDLIVDGGNVAVGGQLELRRESATASTLLMYNILHYNAASGATGIRVIGQNGAGVTTLTNISVFSDTDSLGMLWASDSAATKVCQCIALIGDDPSFVGWSTPSLGGSTQYIATSDASSGGGTGSIDNVVSADAFESTTSTDAKFGKLKPDSLLRTGSGTNMPPNDMYEVALSRVAEMHCIGCYTYYVYEGVITFGAGGHFPTLGLARQALPWTGFTGDVTLSQVGSFEEIYGVGFDIPSGFKRLGFNLNIVNDSPHNGVFGAGHIITIKTAASGNSIAPSLEDHVGGLYISGLQFLVDPAMAGETVQTLFCTANCLTVLSDIIVDGNDVDYECRIVAGGNVEGSRFENCVVKRCGAQPASYNNSVFNAYHDTANTKHNIVACTVHFSSTATNIAAFGGSFVAGAEVRNCVAILSGNANNEARGGSSNDFSNGDIYNCASTDATWLGADPINNIVHATEFISTTDTDDDFLTPKTGGQLQNSGIAVVSPTESVEKEAYGSSKPIGAYAGDLSALTSDSTSSSSDSSNSSDSTSNSSVSSASSVSSVSTVSSDSTPSVSDSSDSSPDESDSSNSSDSSPDESDSSNSSDSTSNSSVYSDSSNSSDSISSVSDSSNSSPDKSDSSNSSNSTPDKSDSSDSSDSTPDKSDSSDSSDSISSNSSDSISSNSSDSSDSTFSSNSSYTGTARVEVNGLITVDDIVDNPIPGVSIILNGVETSITGVVEESGETTYRIVPKVCSLDHVKFISDGSGGIPATNQTLQNFSEKSCMDPVSNPSFVNARIPLLSNRKDCITTLDEAIEKYPILNQNPEQVLEATCLELLAQSNAIFNNHNLALPSLINCDQIVFDANQCIIDESSDSSESTSSSDTSDASTSSSDSLSTLSVDSLSSDSNSSSSSDSISSLSSDSNSSNSSSSSSSSDASSSSSSGDQFIVPIQIITPDPSVLPGLDQDIILHSHTISGPSHNIITTNVISTDFEYLIEYAGNSFVINDVFRSSSSSSGSSSSSSSPFISSSSSSSDLSSSSDSSVSFSSSSSSEFSNSTGSSNSSSSVQAGVEWTIGSVGSTAQWRAVEYGNSIFVAASANDNGVHTSSDGIAWTHRTTPSFSNGGMGWNGTVFAILHPSGTGGIRSTDGISWSTITQPLTFWCSDIASDGNIFVAVAIIGPAVFKEVMTSHDDGVTWISRTVPGGTGLYGVTYAAGLFVASGNTSNPITTSPDGINWTARTASNSNTWGDISYGNGIFVAITSSGSGDIITSPDGITWTYRPASLTANTWRDVHFGGGLFVAVGQSGVGNRVMTSSNGIDWTTRASAADLQWISTAYGNGTFVSVSQESPALLNSMMISS